MVNMLKSVLLTASFKHGNYKTNVVFVTPVPLSKHHPITFSPIIEIACLLQNRHNSQAIEINKNYLLAQALL